jgi:hypothetical protein
LSYPKKCRVPCLSLSLTRLRSVPPRPARPPLPLLTRAPAARPPHRDLDLALVVAGLATTRGGAGGRQRRNLLQLLRLSLRKGSVLFSSFLLFLVLATIAAAIASRHLQALSRVGIGGCALICSCQLRRWGDFLFWVCHPHLG